MSAQWAVGTIGRDVPLEILDAAGARAIRLRGQADMPLEAADRYLGVGVDPAIRSLLAVQLDRRFAGLDALVVSSDTDASQRLFYLLREMRRVDPGAGVPPVHLVDVLHRPRASSQQYTLRVLEAFVRVVQEWTGGRVDDAALIEASALRDQVRQAQRTLLPLRHDHGPRLSGTLFQSLVNAGGELTPIGYLHRIERTVAEAPGHTADDRPRVLLTGSGHDDARVVQAIEAAGAVVVADDHSDGELEIGSLVSEQSHGAETAAGPLNAIAKRWHANGPTSHRASIATRAHHTAALAREADADVIIAYVRERDDAPLWDASAQRRASGIPVALIAHQRYGEIDEGSVAAALSAARARRVG